MVNKAVLFLLVFLVVFGVFGCSSEISVEPGVPVCLFEGNIGEAMDICEDVLVKMHFQIEKFDVDKGFIKTRPLRGAQFFEFWRSDNVGAENKKNSNMHSILRTVELQITENNGEFCVECDTRMRRLSIPSRDLSGSTGKGGTFTGSSRSFPKLRPDTDNLEWIEMGTDSALEQRILGRILYKSEKNK
jgi:hypothetical protein